MSKDVCFRVAGKRNIMENKDKSEMNDEYDFCGKQGVRGKYYKALQKGYKTIIHKSDSSTIETEKRPIARRIVFECQ